MAADDCWGRLAQRLLVLSGDSDADAQGLARDVAARTGALLLHQHTTHQSAAAPGYGLRPYQYQAMVRCNAFMASANGDGSGVGLGRREARQALQSPAVCVLHPALFRALGAAIQPLPWGVWLRGRSASVWESLYPFALDCTRLARGEVVVALSQILDAAQHRAL